MSNLSTVYNIILIFATQIYIINLIYDIKDKLI